MASTGNKEVIEQALSMRAEAYELENKAKALKAVANHLLEPLLKVGDMVEQASVGRVICKKGAVRDKLDVDMFKLGLVQNKVKSDLIQRVEKECTTTNTGASSLQFTPWKEEE